MEHAMIYDIVIVGAGPAGTTFARKIASRGQRILIIDGQQQRHSKPCGGLLAPDAQKALAHFDLVLPKSVLVDPQIFSVKTMDLCTGQIRHYQRYYLNMDRYAFDRWLLSLVGKDVEICSGRCLGIRRQNHIFYLTVSVDGQEQTIATRHVVGADGANSLVRRTFFPDRMMRYVAIQQWFSATKESVPFYSCIFDPKTSESCSWMIHKDDHVIFGGCFAVYGCRSAFEEQKQRLADFLGTPFGALQKTEACLVCRPRRWSDFITGQDGVFLIGEAAGLISASSFEGISSAILSGKLLAQAFSEGGDPQQIAKSYRAKSRKLRMKLALKMLKRWFMYTPWVRKLILASGLESIRVEDLSV